MKHVISHKKEQERIPISKHSFTKVEIKIRFEIGPVHIDDINIKKSPTQRKKDISKSNGVYCLTKYIYI